MTKIYKSWKDYPAREWRWPSFSPQEMACRGTGKLMIVPDAMDKLQALRAKLGKPMVVNSAYRSPEHNRAVGGAKNSKHMQGIAFDVRMDNHDPAEYIAAALSVGFNGIGTYPRQGFVHVDARATRAAWGDPFPKRKADQNTVKKIPIDLPHVEPELPKTWPTDQGTVKSFWADLFAAILAIFGKK